MFPHVTNASFCHNFTMVNTAYSHTNIPSPNYINVRRHPHETIWIAISSFPNGIAYPQLNSNDLGSLPDTHTKATLFYKPRIVHRQWLFWVDQFDLEVRLMSAQTHRDLKVDGNYALDSLHMS